MVCRDRWLVTFLDINALQCGFLSLHIQLMIDIIIDAETFVDVACPLSRVSREESCHILVNHSKMVLSFRVTCALMVICYHFTPLC